MRARLALIPQSQSPSLRVMSVNCSKIFRVCVVAAIALSAALAGCNSATTDDVDSWPTTPIIDVASNSAATTEDVIGENVTLINLWALWCAPCREELPRLQEVSEKYKTDLSVVGVNIGDDFDKTLDYINEASLTFPMYWDESGELLTALKIPSVPATLAVDANGDITWFHLGALSAEELESKVSELVTS